MNRHRPALALEPQRLARVPLEGVARQLVVRSPTQISPSGAFEFRRAATFTASPSTWNSRTTGPRMSPPTSSPVLIPMCVSNGDARSVSRL